MDEQKHISVRCVPPPRTRGLGEKFLDLYQHADQVGRARLLDGSVPRGPSSWLRRVPRAPAYSDGRGIFEFHHPTDYPIALATDLLVRPPGCDYCRTD